MGTDQTGIDAADSDRVDVEIAADAEDSRIDEAVEHHRGDVDGLLVRYAPAFDHARRDSQRLGDLGGLWAATMHHHHAHAEVVEYRDLLDQRPRGVGVAKHTATGLHYEGFALVHADIGGGALERPDGQGLFASVHDHVISFKLL